MSVNKKYIVDEKGNPKETKDRINDILKHLETNPLKYSGIKQMVG